LHYVEPEHATIADAHGRTGKLASQEIRRSEGVSFFKKASF
jgi:hypothetical protein